MAPTLYDARSTLLHWLRPKPAKRVAVAFSGMFRNNEPGNTRNTMRRTMDSYRKHLELANPDFEVDFFFHVYIHTASAELDVRSIEYIRTFPNVRALVVEIFTQDIIDSFVETFSSAPFADFLPGFERDKDCPTNASLPPGATLPHNCGQEYQFGFLSSLRKMYLANALVQDYAAKNQIEYAFVIRARLDRFLGADLVLSRLPRNKITTPKLNVPGVWYTWPNWMEDQFAVAPPPLMDRYTSLFTQVGQMFQKSNELFRSKDAWVRDGCTNTSSPFFCQEWLETRLFSSEEVHPITYPIRCWESAHAYGADEMAEWSHFERMGACSRSSVVGHKTVKPDPPTVTWDELSCAFKGLSSDVSEVAVQRGSTASFVLVLCCALAICAAYALFRRATLPPTGFAFVSLSLLATQQTLLIRWSRDAKGQLPYDSAAAVLLTETIKLLVASARWYQLRRASGPDGVYDGLAGLTPRHFVMFAVPSMIYALQVDIRHLLISLLCLS